MLLFLAAVRLYRDHSPARLIGTLVLAAFPVTIYGLLQAAGLEPLGWQAVEGGPQVFATFGNANFFAAWLGIAIPLCLWVAASPAWSPLARAGAAVLAVTAFAAAYASHSLQGPAGALAGGGVLAAVAPFASGGNLRRRAPLMLGAVAAVAAGGGMLLLAGAGPLGPVRAAALSSLDTRVGKWQAAVGMWADHPLLGVGLDGYADWYHRYRSVEVAAQNGVVWTADTAHNVVLDMLASGGLLLASSYVAVVGFTGWALVHGLRRLEGEQRLLLGGLGGAWVAYQVQALVSIDVPPLAVLHWVLAGLIVAVGTRRCCGSGPCPVPPPSPSSGRSGARAARRPAPGPRPQPLAPASPELLVGIAVAALAGLWLALIPVRADAAAADAANAAAAGRTEEALDSYRRAAALASWEARYPAQEGAYLTRLGRREEALARHEEAAARDPAGLAHPVNVGRLAAGLGDLAEADRAYARVLELDPKTPEILVEVGRYRLARGDLVGASALLEQAVAARGDNAQWWLALGQARSADGDAAGARAAYQRALDLDPASAAAAEALARLA